MNGSFPANSRPKKKCIRVHALIRQIVHKAKRFTGTTEGQKSCDSTPKIVRIGVMIVRLASACYTKQQRLQEIHLAFKE